MVALPKDRIDARILLQNADTAMVKQRSWSKSAAISSTSDTTKQRRMTARQLEAPYRLRGLQYQIATPTSTINGAEALVRWKHPVSAYISPAAFIPVAERAWVQ
ncbi:hypothetical protein OH492_04780 [Vibrio chagasii]|nr:hypothetical protein [Vibrio chagasii]